MPEETDGKSTDQTLTEERVRAWLENDESGRKLLSEISDRAFKAARARAERAAARAKQPTWAEQLAALLMERMPEPEKDADLAVLADELVTAREVRGKADGEAAAKLKLLERQLETERKRLVEAEAKRKELEEERKAGRCYARLRALAEKLGAIAPDDVVELLSLSERLTVGEDGEPVVVDDAGEPTGGSVEETVRAWLSERPHMLRPGVSGGGGQPAVSTGAGPRPTPEQKLDFSDLRRVGPMLLSQNADFAREVQELLGRRSKEA